MNGHLVLLAFMTVTSYRATPAQTKPECRNRNSCHTATGDNFSEQGIAISQEYLRSGQVHYGDVICVDGLRCGIVNDTMANRIRNSVDIPVYTLTEEKKINVQHHNVYILRTEK